MDINLKVRNLIKTNQYYFSLKRKTPKNYWVKKKNPDGINVDRLKNFQFEKKNFIENNKSLLKIINSVRFDSVCDVGCGPGFLLSYLKCKKKYGIENDKKAASLASKFGKIYELNLNKKINLNEKFDLVVCYHTIEHIKKPELLIRELKKILNKNGRLIIGTPDFDSAMARHFKNKYRMLHDKTHISLFSLDSMSRFLRDNKLTILEIDFPYFDTNYFNIY